MKFIPYNPEKHLDACLEIYDSNCPKYFTVEERDEFKDWLNKHKEQPYWVMTTDNNEIVGCGGIYIVLEDGKSEAEFLNEAGFAWGMVHNNKHKKGFGKALTLHRLEFLQQTHPERPIVLRTSQHTHEFFKKLGFTTRQYVKNGWEDGLDKVVMVFEK